MIKNNLINGKHRHNKNRQQNRDIFRINRRKTISKEVQIIYIYIYISNIN